MKNAAAKVRDAYLLNARNVLPAPVTGYVAQRAVQVGQRVSPGTPLMAIVPLDGVWVDANFKEPQLQHMRIGQPVTLTADVYGGKVMYHGHVVGFGAGTGAAFAVLPAQNATGNWIKVVQRVPVRIALDPKELEAHPLRIGLSMEVDVDTRTSLRRALASCRATGARLRHRRRSAGNAAAMRTSRRSSQVTAAATHARWRKARRSRTNPPRRRAGTATCRTRPQATTNASRRWRHLRRHLPAMANQRRKVAPSASHPPLKGGVLVLGTVAVALATFMNVLDSSIANVAIPTISGDLGVSVDEGTWVITLFAAANAIAIPLTGWLTQRVGQVKLFVRRDPAVRARSWLCGIAPTLESLLVARVIARRGGRAADSAVASASAVELPEGRSRARAGAVGDDHDRRPVAGPLLGGWITDNYSWSWIFYINMPVGLFAAA